MSYLDRFLKRVRGEGGGELLSVLSVGSPKNIHSERGGYKEGGGERESSNYREIDNITFWRQLYPSVTPPLQTILEPLTDKTDKSQDGCEECGHVGAATYVELAGGTVDAAPMLLCGSCYGVTLRDVARLQSGNHLEGGRP